MAIRAEDKNTEVVVTLSNGHLEVLKKATTKFNLKDYEATFTFALALLAETEGDYIAIMKKGSPLPVKPSDDLVKKEASDASK